MHRQQAKNLAQQIYQFVRSTVKYETDIIGISDLQKYNIKKGANPTLYTLMLLLVKNNISCEIKLSHRKTKIKQTFKL